eukprot:gnl/MRDRNA2_/MRDRNA2_169684_c0_seq1.p1 gnl/MRDRNA2_/MRDRNA2_169684_c0~~gnl/MRDRNA2_/MRDRNA2_169684_c0_seq1.p1  ORF type:complete len:710 (-),score=121.64 gnl/MRDRNA2_/MRDRNA2_169684_c0_seq1:135-2264(-)
MACSCPQMNTIIDGSQTSLAVPNENSSILDSTFVVESQVISKKKEMPSSSQNEAIYMYEYNQAPLQFDQPHMRGGEQEEAFMSLFRQMHEQQMQRLDAHFKQLEQRIVNTTKVTIAAEVQNCMTHSNMSKGYVAQGTPATSPDTSSDSKTGKSSKQSSQKKPSVKFSERLSGSDTLVKEKSAGHHDEDHGTDRADLRRGSSTVTSGPEGGLLRRLASNISSAMGLFHHHHKDLEGHHSEVKRNFRNVASVASGRSRTMSPSESRMGMWRIATQLLQSTFTEGLVLLVIVANTLYMAWETDWVAQNLQETEDSMPWVRGVELFFTIFFCLDLLLRIFVERTMFLTGRNAAWNLLDAFVVFVALLEEGMRLLSSESAAVSSTKVVRVLRVLRLVRIVRFIRGAAFFAELRAICMGLAQTVGSLFWATLLLFIVIFVFSMYVTQGVAFYLMDINHVSSEADELLQGNTNNDVGFESNLRIRFGSLMRTMYSLWKAISGGSDWQSYADPLFVISWAMGSIFLVYIVFSVCALLNVVTGIFVNRAIKIAESDMDIKLLESIEARKEHIDAVKSVFEKADVDGSGTLSREEFEEHFDNPCVNAFLESLDLDLDGIKPTQLFDLLDFDGDSSISTSEFIYGCSTMKGYATNIELARVSSNMHKQYEELTKSLTAINVALANTRNAQQKDFEKLMRLRRASTMSRTDLPSSESRTEL